MFFREGFYAGFGSFYKTINDFFLCEKTYVFVQLKMNRQEFRKKDSIRCKPLRMKLLISTRSNGKK
ncbi:hypothetical protein LEP1GSC108_0781 [Leptospira weilii str. UI 13098]|uniref:Uncharacterized protein n=1 Tax=Leptospira weilii str. UI 13098 TaxID=1088542 RepID=M6Q4L4_9LEPT|nr:hypothetical protein LEP1GSC108_0781 [Leptospira weilii str. UI 13098]